MRAYLAFLLAIMLSLNAAYAASVGVCDALEHTSNHAAHFGHHSHEHSDDHAHDEPAVDADGGSDISVVSDHHHDHVHAAFSCLLSDTIDVIPLEGCSPLIVIPDSTFISAPQALIEHPPRAALA
ncbi:MAG: hypothetical protein HYU79_01875 [Nitrosomonadales bacterium]|nr:hypothetical protein [Nitrosomonadales bacterium]